MSELTKKILESGLVDQSTAELMEKWGYLPDGSAELAAGKAEALMRATVEKDVKETLTKLAERIGQEVDSLRRTRETMLDLNHLKWPVLVGVWNLKNGDDSRVFRVHGLMDRLGRYYFHPKDVWKEAFVPGFVLMRGADDSIKETILEVTELFVGDQSAAIQVSTQ